MTEFVHDQAAVAVEELDDGRRRVTVTPRDADLFMPIPTCETAYPVELVERMLDRIPPAFLCAEIVREESDLYLRLGLRNYMLSYVDEREFEGVRVLDFGCGAGASTIVLARMFPDAEITGVADEAALLAVAESRARLLHVSNAAFARTASRTDVPADLGTFRHVVLSGVYEHLLRDERREVLSKLWRTIEPGGVLFVSQTPNRLYPLEAHTTNLPLVNYLPQRAAWWFVRRFSTRLSPNETWDSLLRSGVRGATRAEIVRNLSAAPGEAAMLTPYRLGNRSEADIWYTVSMARNAHAVKSVVRPALRALGLIAGGDLVPALHLAIRKR